LPRPNGSSRRLADDHLGASGPQGRCPVVLAADHGANRKPAIEEQPGHGSPDRAELTGCPGYEDRSVVGQAISVSRVELLPGYAPTRQNPAAVAQCPPFRSHSLR